MKAIILFISRDKDFYAPPTALKGWTGQQYGTAMWNPEKSRQICRIPEDKWNAAMEEDIAKLCHLPGNIWTRGIEYVCEDGSIFTTLQKALEHEAQPANPPAVVPSGIPITREFVERAGAEQLRKIADLLKVPGYRKLPKADDLRPVVLTFLGYEVEQKQAVV